MARMTDFSDAEQHHHLDKIKDFPDFGLTPFVAGPALTKRRVAIVTTAGLHLRDDRPFDSGAADYRVIPGDAPAADLIMSHLSVNFDRTGFQEDINVVFPLDRLRELATEGVIGSVAEIHYSFMGATQMRALEAKARELAGLLKKDRVDAVLLSPVWPNCTCAVGALGHYLEREGIATAQISLIREQTAAIRPPRALWVPFMLGRPFGAPDAPDFQRGVLRALLSLFERAAGPVLEDFPEDAPAGNEQEGGFACPVSFAVNQAQGEGLPGALRNEIAQLSSWYDLALRRRGRTTVGVFGKTVDAAVRHVAAYCEGHPEAPPSGMTAGAAVKRACDDIKAYYFEAAAAQPGNLSSRAIEQWFWSETTAARAFLMIRDLCLVSDDASLKPLGKLSLIPRSVSAAGGRQT